MMRQLFRWLKPVLICIVVLSSFISFLNATADDTVTIEKILIAFYNSILLFIMGGQDIGFPETVITPFTQILWINYFLAPLLTVSYIYEFILRRFLEHIPRKLANHTVICGLGSSGRVIYELLREEMPAKHKIILIDQNLQHSFAADYQKHHSTWWLKKDFTKRPALEKAHVQTAERIFLTTDMDLENLNALIEIQSLQQRRHRGRDKKRLATNPRRTSALSRTLYCHLSSLDLRENLQATLFKEAKFSHVLIINGYYSVTLLLYRKYVKEYISCENGVIFIFFGYGFFGKMLYHHLQSDPERGQNDEIYIATLLKKSGYDIDLSRYSWENETPSRCRVYPPMFNDLHDPALWKNLDDQIGASIKRVVIFLCRDNDIANLELAVSIKRKGPRSLRNATIFCRVFREATEELQEMLENRLTPGQEKDIILFPMQKELKAAFGKEIFKVS